MPVPLRPVFAEPAVSAADVRAAHRRIGPYVLRTPLSPSPILSKAAGCELMLKQENRQLTGSFKPRGALNKMMSLSDAERARGLVAASAGNHALGVAYAASVLGLSDVHIYVQRNAAQSKIAKLSTYAVNVHFVGTTYEEAHQAAMLHVGRTAATYLSAYDDSAVIAGQGTCGLEIVEDDEPFDTVVVPVGGGALIGGIAVAVKHARPSVRVIGVNPVASPSALLSFQRGVAIDPYEHEPTLAQGLAGGFGKVPFSIARRLIDDIVLVTEDEIKRAIVALIDAEQTLAEASGAAALAAVLSGRVPAAGRTVVVVSGGNLDREILELVLAETTPPSSR